MNVSLPPPPFERFHVVALDLVASRLLPLTTTAVELMSKFYEKTPLQNTIREVFLAHLRQREQEYNQKHQEVLNQLPQDTSLRTRFVTEQDLLHRELKERFGRRYTGPIFLMKKSDTFTKDRWCQFLLHQYTLADHQKAEARDLILSPRFNQQFLHCDQSGSPKPDSPFVEFSQSAVKHIERKAYEIVTEYALQGALSQHKDKLTSIPQAKRNILLMNAFRKSYCSIQALISDSGSLDKLKAIIKSHPKCTVDLQLSGQMIFGKTAPSTFEKQVQEIQAVFTSHQREATKEPTTLKLPIDQFSVTTNTLNSLCTQFYTESLRFYSVFSDFVDLLQVHQSVDVAPSRGTPIPPLPINTALSSSNPKVPTVPLLFSRASDGRPSSTPMLIDIPDTKGDTKSATSATSATTSSLNSSPSKRHTSSPLQRSSNSSLTSTMSASSSSDCDNYDVVLPEQLQNFVQLKTIFNQIVSYCPQPMRQTHDTNSPAQPSSNYFGSI